MQCNTTQNNHMGPSNSPIFLLAIIFLPSLLRSQQPYEGVVTTDCKNQHNSTSLLGYFCNGLRSSRSCQAYLTFHSQSPYQSVSTISALMGSDPSQLSLANAVSEAATFPTNTKVIIPIRCSCSGAYYQSNASYVVQSGETTFAIANNTYQGLSTCQALQAQNNISSSSGDLIAGTQITVPLRCACPSTNQSTSGVKYLLSYLVDSDDNLFLISKMFEVTRQSIIDANELSSLNPTIYPVTTLLIPLQNQPNSSLITTLPPPPPPPLPPSSAAEKSPDNTGVYVGIGVAVGVVAFIASLVFLCVFLKARRKAIDSKMDDARPDGKSFGDTESSEGLVLRASEIGPAFKVYNFEELQLATENFSDKRRIAGSVYRGVFNGDIAAVKVMNRDVSNEIALLKRVSHFNLITLSGVSFGQSRYCLVYEYAQNGSLSSWIFDKSGSMVLSWMQRVQIALDVADGLNYLHSYTKPAYVHKDVNSSNVLLDDKFRAKIAKFGLARPTEGKEGEFAQTKHIVGTRGYMAPEYLELGLVSPKLDVYAFGVVMMEIITGKDVDTQRGGNEPALDESTAVFSEENAREELGGFIIIDPLLQENYPMDLVPIVARLIEGCLRSDAGSRPSMEEISQSLSKIYDASLSWAASINL